MPTRFSFTHRRGAPRRRHRRWALGAGLAALAVETAVLAVRTSRVGGNVVVRCRAGHLFTTIWVPGASLKSVRLGWWRLQRCPVGHHWSLVTPVRETDLSPDELTRARDCKDVRIP